MCAGAYLGAKVAHVLLHEAQYFLNLGVAIRQRRTDFSQLLFNARTSRRLRTLRKEFGTPGRNFCPICIFAELQHIRHINRRRRTRLRSQLRNIAAGKYGFAPGVGHRADYLHVGDSYPVQNIARRRCQQTHSIVVNRTTLRHHPDQFDKLAIEYRVQSRNGIGIFDFIADAHILEHHR